MDSRYKSRLWICCFMVLFPGLTVVFGQDADGDGMPDWWEQSYGLDWQVSNALDDDDGDHLENIREFYAGCDPTCWDSDGDGLPDGWEVERGFPPTDAGLRAGVTGIERRGHLDTAGWARRLAAWSNYLVVADCEGGLLLVDPASVTNPVIVSQWNVAYPEEVRGVAVKEDEACAALWGRQGSSWMSAVEIVGLTTTGALTSKQRLPVKTGLAWDATADSDRFIVALFAAMGTRAGSVPHARAWLLEHDGTNWFDAGELGRAREMGFVSRIRFGADTLYVADRQAGLSAWPVTATGGAARASLWRSVDTVEDAVERDGYLYLACASDGLLSLAVDDYTLRHAVTRLDSALGMTAHSNWIWVAMGTAGVACVDISVPGWPVLICESDTKGFAEDVLVINGTVWVADGSNGVVSLELVDLDADGDGMSDDWEMEHFGTLSRDGTEDYDGDGLSDRGEFLAGMNPKEADEDMDGLPDGWEVRHGLDPFLDDAGEDPDGDGFSNMEEWIAGSDPRSAKSVFRLSNGYADSAGISLSWWGVSGRLYRLLSAPAVTGSYDAVMTATQIQSGILAYTNSSLTGDRLFFRAQVEQSP